MQVLNSMTPLDYLARYVSISSSRRQLYNKVYTRHRSLKDNMLNETVSVYSIFMNPALFDHKKNIYKMKSISLIFKTLLSGLEEVMGSSFSDKQKETFWKQMGIVLKSHVRFQFNWQDWIFRNTFIVSHYKKY